MIGKIRKSFTTGNIQWRKHSLERMLERGISREDVQKCIQNGRILREYVDTGPYPGYLIEGPDINDRNFHAVIGFDKLNDKSYIITVYYPD